MSDRPPRDLAMSRDVSMTINPHSVDADDDDENDDENDENEAEEKEKEEDMSSVKEKVIAAKSQVSRSCLQSLIPIGDKFYDDKRDEDLVAEKSVVVAFNTVLFAAQVLALVAFLIYYSVPASYVRDLTIQVEWDYGAPGYNCTPMMANQYWSSRLNYDTCKLYEEAPSATNINATGTGWTYKPFPFYTKKAGIPITTFDQTIYGTTDLGNAAQTKFRTLLKTKNACATDGDYENTYTSMAEWEIKKAASGKWTAGTPVTAMTKTCTTYASGSADEACKADSCARAYNVDNSGACGAASGTYEPEYFCKDYGNMDVFDVVATDSCFYNHSHPLLSSVLTYAGFPAGTATAAANTTWPAAISSYQRGYNFTPCYITADEAMNMFKEWYSGDHVCAFAKANAPFSCEQWRPYPALERLSLAYANSLLMYTVFSAICVKVFLSNAPGSQASNNALKL